MLGRMLLAAASLLALAGTARAEIDVAVAAPITGSNASFGAQLRHGAEQAVADLNAAGGVLGQKLVLHVGDDACDPKQAVSVANQLADQGVVVVDGHYCSSSSIPASKVYGEEGVLQISPASTNPAYTDKGGWNTFRVCGRDDQQGKVAGQFLAAHFPGRKVAVLHDNTAYGKGLADETKKFMNAAGLQETMYAAYVPGERDYAALVSRMKAAGIQVIYLGGYQAEAGLIIRQAKQQGMDVTLMGGDALVTSEFWQITGSTGEGTMMTFPSDPRTRPSAAAVVASFRKQGIDPEGYVLYSYATFQIWAAAAAKAGTADPHKVAETLKSAGPWDSVLGKIGFDAKGDITEADYVVYVWHDGGYHQL